MISISFAFLATFALTGASILPEAYNSRIVGGQETEIEKYPHQVSLQYQGKHICGASIIGDNWVLSAAHCVNGDRYANTKFSIRVGSSFNDQGGVVIDVVEIIAHEEYNKGARYNNDFAVLRVAKAMPMGPTAKKIQLTKKPPTTDTALVVTGWGAIKEGGAGSKKLKEVTISAIDRRLCEAIYSSAGMTITKEMLCAGDFDGGNDACQGDSGGALIDPATGEQVGIVSWGVGCGQEAVPRVFSNIANPQSRGWIRAMTGLPL